MQLGLNFRLTAWSVLAILAATAGFSASAHADAWPTRDITFYVPYAPGGSTDPISRKYAELLEKQLKVKVIVENKPGASATIGTGAVIRAAPDGYTIGLGSTSSLAYQPLEMKGLAWKSADDYQSIAKLSDLPAILAVPTEARWKTFDDFMAEAKANPRKLDFANQRGKCRHVVVRPDTEIGIRDPARGRHGKGFREEKSGTAERQTTIMLAMKCVR